jgi:hypothetical protein
MFFKVSEIPYEINVRRIRGAENQYFKGARAYLISKTPIFYYETPLKTFIMQEKYTG